MMRRALLLGGAMLLLASSVEAQTGDPRLSRLDAQTATAVQALVDSARTLGVPTEPLVDQALHAATRKASGTLTVSLVRNRLGMLVQARAALDQATEPEIIAGADAIKMGASPETLRELRRARPSMELTVPIGVLADLIGRGVARDTASALMLHLAGMNMEDRELTEFRRMVDRDITLGALPTAAAVLRAEAAGVRDLDAAPNSNSGGLNTRPPTSPRPPSPQRP